MQDAARAWDDHASTYAELFAPLTSFIARAMFTMASTRLPTNARILDIACGTGALTLPALQRATRERKLGNEGGLVVSTDFSEKMVELTRESGAAVGAPKDLHRCEQQNGESLSLPDAEFDAVFSCFGIFLFSDRRAGWREAARVLKPGGTFATTVWQGPETNAMLREQIAPIVQALPAHLRPTQRAGWMEIADATSLCRELEELGLFVDVAVRPFQASFAICPWQGAWDALRNNPVMGALLERCTTAELEVVRSAFFDHFRRLAGGDDKPVILDSTCNILIATRR